MMGVCVFVCVGGGMANNAATDQPASEKLQGTIMMVVGELADLCYKNVDRNN